MHDISGDEIIIKEIDKHRLDQSWKIFYLHANISSLMRLSEKRPFKSSAIRKAIFAISIFPLIEDYRDILNWGRLSYFLRVCCATALRQFHMMHFKRYFAFVPKAPKFTTNHSQPICSRANNRRFNKKQSKSKALMRINMTAPSCSERTIWSSKTLRGI